MLDALVLAGCVAAAFAVPVVMGMLKLGGVL